MRIVSPKKIFAYGINLIKQDLHTKSHFRWMIDNAKEHNFEFKLNKNSNVLDLGGYKGDWANEIDKRYGCNIFIFEPVNEFYKNVYKRFEDNNKIKVYNFGISDCDKKVNISKNKDGSSTHRMFNESILETI